MHTLQAVDEKGYHLKCLECDFEVRMDEETLQNQVMVIGDPSVQHNYATAMTMKSLPPYDPWENWADNNLV